MPAKAGISMGARVAHPARAREKLKNRASPEYLALLRREREIYSAAADGEALSASLRDTLADLDEEADCADALRTICNLKGD
ncbi:hypothetical protein [Albidovulum sp.]|jgi:hypothetical protein|uniref:hypothetical protein n=1 Tax=Albidovulum sp. TaxID=1872424 RepID=UPI0039B856A0